MSEAPKTVKKSVKKTKKKAAKSKTSSEPEMSTTGKSFNFERGCTYFEKEKSIINTVYLSYRNICV